MLTKNLSHKLCILGLVTLISLVFLILIGAISNGRIEINSLLSFFFYFSLTYGFCRFCEPKLSTRQTLAIIITSCLLIQTYTIYLALFAGAFGAPILVVYSFGIAAGFALLTFRRPLNIVPLLVGLLFVGLMIMQGWSLWQHKVNFGTFTGRVNPSHLPSYFQASFEDGTMITSDDFRDKVVLIDIWNTQCGVCFSKFPLIQDYYEKSRNEPSILVLAANWPVMEDGDNTAFNSIKSRGYSFPVVVLSDLDLPTKWGVKGLPTTFVLNRDGEIVFRGDVERAIDFVSILTTERQ